MYVAHARDDLLLGFGVERKGEGAILLRQTLQTRGDLLLIALGQRLDAHGIRRGGELDARQLDLLADGAQRISRDGAAELGDKADVARANGRGFRLLVAADEENLAHFFGLP